MDGGLTKYLLLLLVVARLIVSSGSGAHVSSIDSGLCMIPVHPERHHLSLQQPQPLTPYR